VTKRFCTAILLDKCLGQASRREQVGIESLAGNKSRVLMERHCRAIINFVRKDDPTLSRSFMRLPFKDGHTAIARPKS